MNRGTEKEDASGTQSYGWGWADAFLPSKVQWCFQIGPPIISHKILLGLLFCGVLISRLSADSLDNWHWRNPLPQGNPLNAVAYGNGHYVAVGDNGDILNSTDGLSWEVKVIPSRSFYGVAFGQGTFVAVGSGGAILQSDPLNGLHIEFDSVAELTISGLNGRTYGIESRDNFEPGSAWQPSASILLTNSPQIWRDIGSGNLRQRYYRTRWPP